MLAKSVYNLHDQQVSKSTCACSLAFAKDCILPYGILFDYPEPAGCLEPAETELYVSPDDAKYGGGGLPLP